MIRKFRRQAERDRAKIASEFWVLVRAFEESLFGLDWDSEKLSEFPIFEKYNEIWIKFSDQWNSKPGQLIEADSMAFKRYAIDQNPGDLSLQRNEETKEIRDRSDLK